MEGYHGFAVLNIEDIDKHFYVSEDVISLTREVILHKSLLSVVQ